MRCAVAVLLCACVAQGASVTPVQKVVGMLNDMKAKGEKEKHEQAVQFATYKQFCESTRGEKTRNIAGAADAIEQLTADSGKAAADALSLEKDIAGLTSDIDGWSAEKNEAVAVREKEHADFTVVHEDYAAAIDAVGRALQVLKSSPGQSFAEVEESLLQVSTLSVRAKSVITSYLQDPSDVQMLLQEGSVRGRQQPKTYESSSGGVIDMVKKLGDKFKEEKAAIEKEEAKKQFASDMIVQGLTDSIERATTSQNEKTAAKAGREKDKAEADGNLEDTKLTKAEDEKMLTDLNSECESKTVEYEKEQTMRGGEITAISKAIEIMSSDKVSGGTQHLPSLVQDGVSLSQFRTELRSELQSRVAVFLKDRAQRTGSRVLSLLAIKTSEDPFKKVTKMIRDMIAKLMEEANEEAEHKGFCDTEMGQNKNTRDEKSSKVETLTATIEQLTADISKLAEEATVLTEAIAANDAAMAKATAERTQESEQNRAIIADAQVAGEATAQALAVLKDFYAMKEGAAFFLQTSTEGAAGVVGMLEVIQSDFVRLETETTSGEDKAAKAFTEFSRDSSKDKAMKNMDLEHKVAAKTEKESELADAKKDLKGNQEELDAALAYFEKLKPSCVDAGQSYEERVAQRKAEIESLQDAMKILSGEA